MNNKIEIVLTNKTQFYKTDLKRFFRKCLEKYNSQKGTNIRRVTILAKHFQNRNGFSRRTGRCHVGWQNMTILFDKELTPEKLIKVADTFYHELYHGRGFRHGQMARRYTDEVQYAKDFIIRKQEVKVKEKPTKENILELKYNKILLNLKRAKTRTKRALTIEKKWKNKLKYYEKKKTSI